MKRQNQMRSMILAFVLSALVMGCSERALEEMDRLEGPGLNQQTKERLGQVLSDYSLVNLNKGNLFPQLEKIPVGGTTHLAVPREDGVPWEMELERNNVVEDGFYGAAYNGSSIQNLSPMKILTFHGTVEGGGSVSLTISPEFLTASMEYGGEQWTIEPIQVFDKEEKDYAVAFRNVDYQLRNGAQGSCKEVQLPTMQLNDPPNKASGKTAQNCWQIDVLVHGDFHYYQQVGGQMNVALFFMIASVNEASDKYRSINIHLRVPSGYAIQNTTPDNMSYDAETLLNQVRYYDNLLLTGYNRDITMFYTGRNMTAGGSSGVAGVAWRGGLCYSPSYAYGVSETINGFYNNRIQAHEYGHILGSPHDFQCNGGLMYPYYNTSCSGDYPSTNSKNAINWHLWFNHDCIYMADGC